VLPITSTTSPRLSQVKTISFADAAARKFKASSAITTAQRFEVFVKVGEVHTGAAASVTLTTGAASTADDSPPPPCSNAALLKHARLKTTNSQIGKIIFFIAPHFLLSHRVHSRILKKHHLYIS